MKQYKYVGKDEQKKGWIAKEKTANYYIENTQDILPKYMVENEPTLRQEVKEDVFENIFNELQEVAPKNSEDASNRLKEVIQKYLGITKEEIYKMPMNNSKDDVVELFSDRGLLI